MRDLPQDLRYALRTIRNNPGFTAAVVLTLALGIGANTAIFSVVHAVLLEPTAYPVENPEDVVVIGEAPPRGGRMGVSYPTFVDWLEQVQSFEHMARFRNYSYNLTARAEPLRVRALMTNASYFEIQGVRPLLGRFYTAEEDTGAGPPVTVMNYGMWQNQFGARDDVIGETVLLDEVPHIVIGVLPPNFELVPEDRFYLPLMQWAEPEASKSRGDHQSVYMLARLKAGVSFEQARAEMTTIAERFQEEYPDTNSGVGVVIERLQERRLREFRPILWLLLGAVAFVLLIACTNVANLLLARSTSRRRRSELIESGAYTPSFSAASCVPSTRAWILAKAVSRAVDVSSPNGEKPQSSQVPSWLTGMISAASRTRSRTSDAVSTFGLMGSMTPTKTRCSRCMLSRMMPRTRFRSLSLASWM